MSRIIALGLLFIIFSGCVFQSSNSNTFINEYAKDFHKIAAFDPSTLEQCPDASCLCMVCGKGNGTFSTFIPKIGGSCYFDQNCTKDKIDKITYKDKSYAIKTFMIGQGPTGADFSSANQYCAQKLKMSVNWLIGSEYEPYIFPDPNRAVCYISQDVMPIYVLYSNEKQIRSDGAEKIAKRLAEGGGIATGYRLSNGPVGPVVITTEIDFNKANAAAIAEQVRQIDRGCNNDRGANPQRINCLVAVAPKINDVEALDAVMSQLGTDKNKVDLVAFGINPRNMKGCDPNGAYIQASEFAKYSLYTYGKPTIIPYMFFEPDGKDNESSCTWTESKVVEAYGTFFPTYAAAYPGIGVIGVAPYSFSPLGVTNPLGCKNCAIGLNQRRIDAWSLGCSAYGKASDFSSNTPGISSIGAPLVFANGSIGFCPSATFAADSIIKGFKYGVGGNKDITAAKPTATTTAQSDPFISCTSCVSESTGKPVFSGISSASVSTDSCNLVPEIEFYSSQNSLDPGFVRAMIMAESNFKNCEVAKVCSKEYKNSPSSSGCFAPSDKSSDDECYNRGYNTIVDPDNLCNNDYHLIAAPDALSKPDHPQWRFCAIGIMQSLEPPHTYWPARLRLDGQNGQYYDVFKRTQDASPALGVDLEAAASCSPKFNPFNASHSICVGTIKLNKRFEEARNEISKAHSGHLLNWETNDPTGPEKDSVLAAYIVASKYRGVWNGSISGYYSFGGCSGTVGKCVLENFAQSWKHNETFCQNNKNDKIHCDGSSPNKNADFGFTDFIEYVKFIGDNRNMPKSFSYAERVINNYYGLKSTCTNYNCPSWKRLIDQGANTINGNPANYQSKNLYVPDGNPLPKAN